MGAVMSELLAKVPDLHPVSSGVGRVRQHPPPRLPGLFWRDIFSPEKVLFFLDFYVPAV